MTPKIHLTAFEDRPGRFIFVAVPDERGRYLRTDKAVAQVACRQCGSMVGEPCKGAGRKYGGTTHYVRRHDARGYGWADDLLDRSTDTPDEYMEPAA